jgi:hypothetical protein
MERILDFWMSVLKASPWDASGFHVVGQCDVITPHVKLPLTQTQDSTQDVAGVDADSHIHIEPCGFTNKSEKQKQRTKNTDNVVDSLEDIRLNEIRTQMLQARLPARW